MKLTLRILALVVFIVFVVLAVFAFNDTDYMRSAMACVLAVVSAWGIEKAAGVVKA